MFSDKKVNLLIVALLLIFTAFYLFVVKTYGGINEIEQLLFQIQKSVENEDWEKAYYLYLEIKEMWKGKTSYWISFNYAEGDFATFEETLARVNSAIKYEDKKKVIEEIDVLVDKWRNFNKIVPKP